MPTATGRKTTEEIRAKRVGQEEVVLEDGGTVLVRGLTRGESHKINKMGEEGDTYGQEVFALHTCLLEPTLTEDDAREWVDNDAGGMQSDLQLVVQAIQRLSKNGDGDGKELTKSPTRQRPRARR